jgi:hypothetical protein
MENTHLNLLTAFNLLALLRTTTGHRFGAQNQRTDASSSAGLFCKIRHGQLTELSNSVARQILYASCVVLIRSLQFTYWRNAPSLSPFGDRFVIGLAWISSRCRNIAIGRSNGRPEQGDAKLMM